MAVMPRVVDWVPESLTKPILDVELDQDQPTLDVAWAAQRRLVEEWAALALRELALQSQPQIGHMLVTEEVSMLSRHPTHMLVKVQALFRKTR